MTLTPQTKLTYYVDAMNVHYWEEDKSLTIETPDDDMIEIKGIKVNTMARLIRNLICCNDPVMNHIEFDDAQSVRHLNEARVALEEWWKEKTEPKPVDDEEIERRLKETYGG